MESKKLDPNQLLVPMGWQLPYYRRTATVVGTSAASSGFTLIELLVVIAIIGLLASVVLVSLNNSRMKSRDARRVADMNQMAKAMELYFNEYNTYPTVTAGGTLSTVLGSAGLPIVPKFLNKLPLAPLPAESGCSAATGISGANDYYMYANSTGATQSKTATYVITFCLGQKTGALPAGPHTLTQAGFQ